LQPKSKLKFTHIYVSPFRKQPSRTFRDQRSSGVGLNSGAKGPKSTIYYIAALGVVALGLSYAAVPLYRIFCQAYSYGGTVAEGHDAERVETMEKVPDRIIKVRFNADTASSMTWNFKPQQREIK
ncbi:Cytochrome c oxidase assembly protein cox11, mitochondrial, partial [Halocaridina rubra]